MNSMLDLLLSTHITALSLRLLEKVKAYGDRLIVLSVRLISSETSNLVESYMAIRILHDGGKQFIHNQSGSIESCCYAARMRCKREKGCHLQALQMTTGESPERLSSKTIHTLHRSRYGSGQYLYTGIEGICAK